MNFYERAYKELLHRARHSGRLISGRNGSTYSLFGEVLKIRLDGGFPLLTGRKMHLQGIVAELACFIQGAEHLATYKAAGCNYWDANAEAWAANGQPAPLSIGQYVGSLWRRFKAHNEVLSGSSDDRDQLRTIQRELRANPTSRRHVLAAWHPGAKSCLPPCTVMAIFDSDGKYLNCHVTQRSADLCLGVPTDVAQYALLTHLLARDAGLLPGQLMFTFVNAHIYDQHVPVLDEYLSQPIKRLPRLRLGDCDTLSFSTEHFKVEGYEHGPNIKFPFVV